MKLFRLPIILPGLYAVGLCTLLFSSASADVINLKDGTSVEGTLKRGDDGWLVRSNGQTTHVPGDQVESIELGPATSPTTSEAMDRPVSPRKMMTPAQRQRLVDQAEASAETARQLMKQGRTKEAQPLLTDCVSLDPRNAMAWYLIGLLRYQQQQLPAARKAFETVSLLVPNHAPTLNNLAVIQWRQNQFIPALMNFDAAMLAATVNKTILDNVAVALQTLPVEQRNNPITLKTLRHFSEQDQQLAALLARDGLHRFGSLWVTDLDEARFEQQEKDIRDKLDQLAGDFQRDKDRADQLDSDITQNQAALHRIEAQSYVVDPRTGAAIPAAYPSSYTDLLRDTDKLTRARDAIVAKMDLIKTTAQNLQRTRPGVNHQGVMLIVGVAGTPIRIPATTAPVSATTQPASVASPQAR